MNHHGTWLLLLAASLLGGCALAAVDQPFVSGKAEIVVGRTSAGERAVALRYIRSRYHVRSQDIDKAEQILLKPGIYTLGLDCMRPGGGILLHAHEEFGVRVEQGQRYVIDCLPMEKPSRSGFVLRQVSDGPAGASEMTSSRDPH